jgi:hypothetical protein
MLIADILITTVGCGRGRPKLLKKTLQSLFENTLVNKNCRVSIIQDGIDPDIDEVIQDYDLMFEHVFKSTMNDGLAPSFNSSFAFLDSKNQYWNDPTVGDIGKVSQMFCYVQDDVVFEKGWLEKQYRLFQTLKNQHNLAMVSGIESYEHPTVKDLGGGLLLKNWVRMTQFLTPWNVLREMLPIPYYDPETKKRRAKPNDGVGSSADWWLCRNHEKSLVKSGRNCLVIPGQLKHIGADHSSWLNRSLPESIEDRKKINEVMK